MQSYEAVVLGVSAGGFNALKVVLSRITDDFPLPVIIVQHRMASPDNYIVTYLNNISNLAVKEADDKEKIRRGHVYLAPADYHLHVEKDHTLSLSVDEPVCHARPSIDVLFETAALAYGPALIGVILTGANTDGSNGIQMIKKHGGLTISQDPATSEAKVMPQAAIDTKSVDFILSLEDIPQFLTDILEEKYE